SRSAGYCVLKSLCYYLECAHMHANAVDELLDGLAHRVRQMGLVEIDVAGHPLAVAICYPPGNADHNGVRGNLAHDDRARPDPAAVTDLEGADDLGPGPDDYVVAQGRVALLAFQARPAEGHALQQGDVRAALGGLADDDAHAVIDEETGAELRGRMDLDARDDPRHVREEAGRDRPAVPPHRVSEPMERQRVHPGIAEQ